MSCCVKFTATAKEDLRGIALYIAEQSKDKAAATRFVTELREKCTLIEQLPESGSIPKDRVMMSAGYRFLVHKEYLIFHSYEKAENTAYVLAVFNAKRDYMRVTKRFL